MSVSILIPHKDSVDKLCRLLDSIPEQVSIVVVDDDSDRANLGRLRTICATKYSNVKLLRNLSSERNAGTARNVAIDNCPAGTTWVIFADADDEFKLDALRRLVNYLKSSASFDIVFFNCVARKEGSDEGSERCDIYSALIKSWPDSKHFIAFCWPVPWGRAIKFNEVIRANNLRFSSRVASNDIEFSAKLALTRPEMTVFSEDVYICSESDSSLTATLTREKALDRLKANISRNRLYHMNQVDTVHYNYCGKFLLKAMPLIFKRRELFIFWAAAKNIYIAFRMNRFSKETLI